MRNHWQTLRTVLRDTGSLLFVLGGFLFLTIIVVFISGEFRTGLLPLIAFAVPGFLSIILGLIARHYLPPGELNRLQAMLVCALGWIIFSFIGALPFVIALKVSYLDAVFETMSGFTTTGITVFIGLDRMPKSILFWRSLTQWVGGLGILTFFLAISFQKGNTHRLFRAESHKIDMGRPVPGVANTLKILLGHIHPLYGNNRPGTAPLRDGIIRQHLPYIYNPLHRRLLPA